MSEALFDVYGVTVTVTGVYIALSVITLALFASLWLFERKKRTGKAVFAGQVMNGVGFGLLPALAILKAFQEIGTGKGAAVTEPLPLIGWLTENGLYRPGRIEAAAAALAFAFVCLWLIARGKDIPDNGDLFMISLCLWAAIRLITEDFRREPVNMFRYTSCATLAACLIVWTVRRGKLAGLPGRTAMELIAAGTCIAINLLTATGILSVGSEIGDFAVKTGSALLVLALTLITGGDLRRMAERVAESKAPGREAGASVHQAIPQSTLVQQAVPPFIPQSAPQPTPIQQQTVSAPAPGQQDQETRHYTPVQPG